MRARNSEGHHTTPRSTDTRRAGDRTIAYGSSDTKGDEFLGHLAVIAAFEPKPGRNDEVCAILQAMVEPTRAEPGCLQYDLYESNGRFVLFERYEDHDAIGAHQETDHYISYRSAIADLLAEPVSVTVAGPVDVAHT